MPWQIQDAKARFSEFLDETLKNLPQVVTKRGVETAVLVSIEEWRRMQASLRLSLKDLLLADGPRFDIPIPERGKLRLRKPVELD